MVGSCPVVHGRGNSHNATGPAHGPVSFLLELREAVPLPEQETVSNRPMPISSRSLGTKSPGAAKGLGRGGREKICDDPFASRPCCQTTKCVESTYSPQPGGRHREHRRKCRLPEVACCPMCPDLSPRLSDSKSSDLSCESPEDSDIRKVPI